MHVKPVCEYVEKLSPGEEYRCESRAEWHVLDKTTGKQADFCVGHLACTMTPGHTFVMTPARSIAVADGVGLTVGEAREKGVCRICGEKAGAKMNPDGTVDPFVLNFGKEYAHESCLPPDERK